MQEETILPIVELRHDAPYAVLGPHADTQEKLLTIRAFLPHAEQAFVLVSKTQQRLPMQKIHPQGLFAARIRGVVALNYQLVVITADGETLITHDPYAIHAPSFTPTEGVAFEQGHLDALFTRFGAHPQVKAGISGVTFTLWAPHASRVSVVGTFNQWDGRRHLLERHRSGVWEVFVPDVGAGALYKYEIRNAEGAVFLKTDPIAFQTEIYPKTAAVVCDVARTHPWTDTVWMAHLAATPAWELPLKLHTVTFDTTASGDTPDRVASYAQLQTHVLPYLQTGCTHVQLSWWAPGETVASYYTPNPRYGDPAEIMAFVDACHRYHIAVVLDWIPATLPIEGQELSWFDGTRLYDVDVPGHIDQLAFAVEKPPVRNVLAANALFWREVYHIDALHTDVRTFIARLQGHAGVDRLRFLLQEPVLWPTIDTTARSVLHQGRHTDPHALLGAHPLADAPGVCVVRALLPDAQSPCVWPVDQPNLLYPLQWVHSDDLFEAIVVAAESSTFRYRFTCTAGDHVQVFDDPYAFRHSILGDQDCYLFAEGNHYRIFEKLGAHAQTVDGVSGTHFAVWAPNAQRISLVGAFNDWDGRCHPMRLRPGSGIWELFLPGLHEGTLYKFEILPRSGGPAFLKTDPFAFRTELPPGTASVVYDRAGKHAWHDGSWMQQRARTAAWERPVSIYEVHAGSWRLKADGSFLSYRELADVLIPYIVKMGFTHIEFLPLAEHPYGPSWGYQISNFYAPTARFGRPDELMELIDRCHQHNIGVILDWVPAHFPKDAHAMAWFDGTCLYEHADPRQGEHPDWGTLIFNYGRHEIENFLIANALYWLETFHFDGLRVDAVASMLYLDYSKKDWIPNQYGGNENLEAIEFIKHTNAVVHSQFPGVMMIAEESTAWPGVSRPTDQGGLGFGFKWNMGWMHDVLFYMQKEHVHRRHHHDKLSFGLVYAFNENFILSLSHDEVVHLKKSMLGKMPGTSTQQFANLRVLYAFMYGHPGKKLLFMGDEFGQPGEWNHDTALEWERLEEAPHAGLQRFVSDLNRLYVREPACHQVDFRGAGFEWIDAGAAETSVLAFVRKARDPRESVLFVLNFSDQAHPNYRIGVPYPVAYRELLNSNAREYGGSGATLLGQPVTAEESSSHGFAFSVVLHLPPLSALVLKPGSLRSTA